MTVGIMISNGIGHGTAPLQTLSGVGVMVAIVLFGLVLKRLVPKLPLMLFLAVLSTVVTIPGAWPLAETTTAVVNQVESMRRSEEHTSELQSLMRISYAVFRLKKK